MMSTRSRGALGAMLWLVTAAGCEPLICTDNECVGGLDWTAITDDGMPLLAGDYLLEVELEDDRFTVACTVASDGAARCDGPVQTVGDRDFRVDVDWFGEQTLHGSDTVETRYGLHITARERVEGGYRGPTDVALTLERDDVRVLEQTFALEYERDENHHGDERCGFCDLVEYRQSNIAQ